MDDKEQEFLKSYNKLTDEEIIRIVEASAKLGIKKIRITGGEPLVRPGIVDLIGRINKIKGIEEIYITTNGTILEDKVNKLVKNGLKGVNISLDSLNNDRFKQITRIGRLEKVLKFIENCINCGLKVKLNTVIVDKINKDEILDFAKLTFEKPIDIRFIELMPIGVGKAHNGVSNNEVIEIIKNKYTEVIEDKKGVVSGPARYIRINNALGRVGFISAVSSCFCKDCNRIRVTADGFLKQCLHFDYGVNIRDLLREGISDDKLISVIEENIYNKPEKHLFTIKSQNEEVRLMNQIGG